MATTGDNKYRVNALAKDLNVKSKDIIDLLAAHGMGNKSHMTALEGAELSIIFEYYTQQNQIDITAFFKSYQDKIDAKKAEEQAKRDAEDKRKADEKAAAKAEKQKKL
ncbi:MAG: translation initiation factor IF-2 N-terminal domain-containing protein, partial [Clostridia bacterium]|nr:translation initiation factor IF-2 N-terminal domain-containing protein [Clostridia bacterium]